MGTFSVGKGGLDMDSSTERLIVTLMIFAMGTVLLWHFGESANFSTAIFTLWGTAVAFWFRLSSDTNNAASGIAASNSNAANSIALNEATTQAATKVIEATANLQPKA